MVKVAHIQRCVVLLLDVAQQGLSLRTLPFYHLNTLFFLLLVRQLQSFASLLVHRLEYLAIAHLVLPERL